MGCQVSNLSRLQDQIQLSIIDPSFLKPVHQSLRSKLEGYRIELKVFMNLQCYLNQLGLELPKYIVIRHQDLNKLLNYLSSKKYLPQLIVLESTVDEKIASPKIRYIGHYNQLPNILLELKKVENNKNSKVEMVYAKQKQKQKQIQIIDIKILKDFKSETSSKIFILQQTLKMKGLSYLIYNSLDELLNSHKIPCKFIIVDYQYHKEVIKSVNNKIVKVICYCQLDSQQNYDPLTYFITNNFQEVVNQIVFYKSFRYPILSLTKIFFYCPEHNKNFARYGKIFEEFNFQVKYYSKIEQIFKATRLYLSVMIFSPEQEVSKMQKVFQAQNTSFRMRVIGIEQQTGCSAQSLRKQLKEAKRGYLMQKGVTKVVDIIDKYHNGNKFESYIGYRCYSDCAEYCRDLKFVSPYIICSYDNRNQVSDFISSVQANTKMIIFCNKIFIDQTLVQSKKWCYVSNHFVKIIKYIKSHQITIPIIVDHNQNRIFKKQQQIKSKQHRISAIKWAETTKSQISIKQDQMSFILTKNDAYSLSVKQICNDSCQLLKVGYNPVENIEKFKEELINSVKFLVSNYKISYSSDQMIKFEQNMKRMNLYELSQRVRQFFGQQKQIGICLNNVIKKIAKIDKNVIFHLKSIFYLINLNFLGIYTIPNAQKIILTNWSKEDDLLHCTVGSLLIFKNYFVMYQQGFSQPLPGCIKLQLEVQYCALNDLNPSINSFFVHNGRYVFSPFSYLVVADIQKQNNNIVIHLKLKRQTDFLKYYYSQNVSKDLDNLSDNQLKKPESQLIISSRKQQIYKNCKRLLILKHYRTGNIQKAIKFQRQLIKTEEQNENFNSQYITQLQFQLANYLLKQNATCEVFKLLQDINQNSCSSYLNLQVCKIISTLEIMINTKEQNETKKFQQQALQVTQLKKQFEKEDNNNVEIPVAFTFQMLNGSQNKIECLQIDEQEWEVKQNFE